LSKELKNDALPVSESRDSGVIFQRSSYAPSELTLWGGFLVQIPALVKKSAPARNQTCSWRKPKRAND